MNILQATLIVLATLPLGQDKPVEVPKAELPKTAVATFCGPNGVAEVERPNMGFRYKGKVYYFCDKPAREAFLKDPEGFLPLPVPRPAPKFSVKSLAGETISLDSLKGKVMLVDFWATWCKPCIETMPDIQKLHDKYRANGLVVLGMSTDEDGAKKVKPFIEKRKFTYPILLDTGKSTVWKSFGVKGVPVLFLLDRAGQIVKEWRGKPDIGDVERAVVDLLK